MKLLKLTEANINRISNGHEKDGDIILSACRNNYSQEKNNARTNELKQWLNNKHYSYIMVYGRYKEDISNEFRLEKSFIVYPFDIVTKEVADWNVFEHDISVIAKKYDEDSILICRPNSKPYYKGLNSKVKDSKCYSNATFNDVAKDYFTAIKKWSDMSLNRKNHNWNEGSPQRFTFEAFEDEDFMPELYLEPYPCSMPHGHTRWAEYNLNHVYLAFNEYKNMFNNDSFVDMV